MHKTIIVLSGLLSSTAAIAQGPAPAPNAAAPVARDDADIVVVATRTPTAADRVSASVTVLDKPAIDRAQDLGVTELLLRTPGVSIARNGGYGTATTSYTLFLKAAGERATCYLPVREDERGTGEALVELGHRLVVKASNGQELINGCLNAEPDLLIVDVKMPVVDGAVG